MAEWIDRILLLELLEIAQIPVTKSERAIILAMPEQGSNTGRYELEHLVRMIRKKNKEHIGIYNEDGKSETSSMEDYLAID